MTITQKYLKFTSSKLIWRKLNSERIWSEMYKSIIQYIKNDCIYILKNLDLTLISQN